MENVRSWRRIESPVRAPPITVLLVRAYFFARAVQLNQIPFARMVALGFRSCGPVNFCRFVQMTWSWDFVFEADKVRSESWLAQMKPWIFVTPSVSNSLIHGSVFTNQQVETYFGQRQDKSSGIPSGST